MGLRICLRGEDAMTRKLKKLAEKSEKITARSGPAPGEQKQVPAKEAGPSRRPRTSPGRLMEFSVIQQEMESEHQSRLLEKEQQIEELKEELEHARVFSPAAEDSELGALLKVPTGELVPSPYQPRIVFNEEEMNELIESVRVQGVQEPLTVRKSDTSAGKYEIISGHRRHHAAAVAGIEYLPVRLVQSSDREAHIQALLSNEARTNPSFIERALSYRQVHEKGYFSTQTELANTFGVSKAYVSQSFAFLDIEPRFIELILDRPHAIGISTAREITALAREYPAQTQLDLLYEGIRRITQANMDPAVLKSWFIKNLNANAQKEKGSRAPKVVVNEKNQEAFVLRPPKGNRLEIIVKDTKISPEELQEELVRHLEKLAKKETEQTGP